MMIIYYHSVCNRLCECLHDGQVTVGIISPNNICQVPSLMQNQCIVFADNDSRTISTIPQAICEFHVQCCGLRLSQFHPNSSGGDRHETHTLVVNSVGYRRNSPDEPFPWQIPNCCFRLDNCALYLFTL